MALNPMFEDIGKSLVSAYYGMFDNLETRKNLVSLYNVSFSFPVPHARVTNMHMVQ